MPDLERLADSRVELNSVAPAILKLYLVLKTVILFYISLFNKQ